MNLLHDSTDCADRPSAALLSYWSRPWTAVELDGVWEQVRHLRMQETKHSLEQGAVVEALAQRLGTVDLASE